MSNLITTNTKLPSTPDKTKELLKQAQEIVKERYEQIELTTVHTIHSGVYTRTITLKPGTFIISGEIKIPTTLIVQGKAKVNLGNKAYTILGYHVLTAQAGRKQYIEAIEETNLTMLFKTDAKTVEEAEEEFTDEYEDLISRSEHGINIINITGGV